MGRAATSYGRYQVPEPPSALRCLHFHQGGPLREVDHEPKMAVLDQEDLLAQGIRVSSFIPGAQDVDALGSCTANATTVALSNVLSEAEFAEFIGRDGSPNPIYTDTRAAEVAAICFYHQCTDQTGSTAEEWPPTDCGSSGPYIVSMLERLGLASGAKIAHAGEDLVSLMQTDGVLMGSPWLQVWEQPDSEGFIDGDGSLKILEEQIREGVAGGHETYLCKIVQLAFLPSGLVDPEHTILEGRNSWTSAWGHGGNYRVHLSTLVRIAAQCDFRQLIA